MRPRQKLLIGRADDFFHVSVGRKIRSLNNFLGSKWKWSNYNKGWATSLEFLKDKQEGKYQVATLIVSYRTRLLDTENLYGGAKPIRDALEDLNWIYLDSPKWSVLKATQRLCKKDDERTEVLHWVGVESFPSYFLKDGSTLATLLLEQGLK